MFMMTNEERADKCLWWQMRREQTNVYDDKCSLFYFLLKSFSLHLSITFAHLFSNTTLSKRRLSPCILSLIFPSSVVPTHSPFSSSFRLMAQSFVRTRVYERDLHKISHSAISYSGNILQNPPPTLPLPPATIFQCTPNLGLLTEPLLDEFWSIYLYISA